MSVGRERRITITHQSKLSSENTKLLKKAYTHPFERIPPKFYGAKVKGGSKEEVEPLNSN